MRKTRGRALAALLTALVMGAATACGEAGAAKEPGPSCPPAGQDSPAGQEQARQVRAMWIASVGNLDWPAKSGESQVAQQNDYTRLLDRAKALNLNTVFVQIRPAADAFYPSPYEPWSQYLTGTQGRDPGYDPLKFLVTQAHERGLDFHAWFNPYRVSTQPDPAKLAPDSPARRHPDWVRPYGGALWYDPGRPEVQKLVTDVVLDVVRKYDIDGVHFDDYFYPYPVAGHDFGDQATFKKYGAGFKSVADWRRHNVDTLVESLPRAIHRVKPWVEFGISPFGVWRNKTSDPRGSDSGALESYDAIYADTRTWIKAGWVDYVAPQLYWPIGFAAADYTRLVAWWARQVAGTTVQLIIGQAGYRAGTAAWRDPAELTRHLMVDARYPQVRGDAFFSARDLVADRRGFASGLRAGPYAAPAIPPVIPRLGGTAPPPPTPTRPNDSEPLTWHGSASAREYAIYRVAGRGPVCLPANGRTLVATVPGDVHEFAAVGPFTYYVSALDRLHHESPATRAATVTRSG